MQGLQPFGNTSATGVLPYPPATGVLPFFRPVYSSPTATRLLPCSKTCPAPLRRSRTVLNDFLADTPKLSAKASCTSFLDVAPPASKKATINCFWVRSIVLDVNTGMRLVSFDSGCVASINSCRKKKRRLSSPSFCFLVIAVMKLLMTPKTH